MPVTIMRLLLLLPSLLLLLLVHLLLLLLRKKTQNMIRLMLVRALTMMIKIMMALRR